MTNVEEKTIAVELTKTEMLWIGTAIIKYKTENPDMTAFDSIYEKLKEAYVKEA